MSSPAVWNGHILESCFPTAKNNIKQVNTYGLLTIKLVQFRWLDIAICVFTDMERREQGQYPAILTKTS